MDFFRNPVFMEIYKTTMQLYKPAPFLCLPMSATLIEMLRHYLPQHSFLLKTGDLLYKDCAIFKQDFDINTQVDNGQDFFASWGGHAWIELDNRYIIDVSLFRTLYSDLFSKPCKSEIIELMGQNRGLYAIDKENHDRPPFVYLEKSILRDNIINRILQGIDKNREALFNPEYVTAGLTD